MSCPCLDSKHGVSRILRWDNIWSQALHLQWRNIPNVPTLLAQNPAHNMILIYMMFNFTTIIITQGPKVFALHCKVWKKKNSTCSSLFWRNRIQSLFCIIQFNRTGTNLIAHTIPQFEWRGAKCTVLYTRNLNTSDVTVPKWCQPVVGKWRG